MAHTVLRPSGKVMIKDKLYDAKSEYGFIDKGEPVKVIRYETGQVYVVQNLTERCSSAITMPSDFPAGGSPLERDRYLYSGKR